MKLLERMGCFRNGTQTVSIQRATTAKELCNAYQLVHDNYVEKGYIFPQPSGLRMRLYEALPETATFVAKAGEEIVGVTSLVFDTPGLGLPSDQVFSEEIDSLRQGGGKVAEVTNWAIAPAYRRTAVLTELIRCYIAHLQAVGCDYAIGAISPGHRAFYELIGYEVIGTERSYSTEINDPVILVSLSLDNLMKRFAAVQNDDEDDTATLKNYYLDNNPHHDQIEKWQTTAHASFTNPVFLRHLFVERTDLLTDCSEEELKILRQQWGEDIFLDVMGHNILQDTFFMFHKTT
jgi:ribosomal protein S18 acetylase RimI-like enzyme